ncbi:glycerol kinase [Niallia circulans]|jgi:glycerol kinase|uniref:glycerol kinase GlpK n=1 Tax=Shouchella clausii TaxID=79880 RepID=UPI000B973111|nr:glycerol kinase GlpK [Shouchella clausii]SPU18807.1 glycerol kinase [Niallia circulans]AST95420.1 glycerol kinase [Shouchella clausii]MCR1286674.1 glycerol kinase GlpK [Shouchella clausii]MEB5471992.1 glycerol kinase GlpK [Shouchella clausii]QNM41774.1 glycerol kinase [Shouchella clausii]
MDDQYILVIDQSTSGTKALIVDQQGNVVAKKTGSHKQIYPQSGWVEHDPIEIYERVKEVINAIAESNQTIISKLKALTITNQRETVIVWDKQTGEPVYNAIVWQCRRTTSICTFLKQEGYEEKIHSKTGLTIDPYFSATKVKWILDNITGARERAENGDLLLGTMDSWLLWKLTTGSVHATDVTNASRTLLFNINSLNWDDELLDIFDIPKLMLPEVKFSDEVYGFIEDRELFIPKIPVSGIIGDSQAALFAQRCFDKGMAKATFGTGTSVMVYTEEHVDAKDGLVTSIAWGLNGEVTYASEGIIHTTGDIMKWMKEDLTLFDDFSEAETLAAMLEDNGGVYLVPAFVGLGAPYWSPNTRAGITGMSRNTNKSHIIRAGLESIVYQVKDVVQLIYQDTNVAVKELKVDGGATTNAFLMQFLSDVLGIRVIVSNVSELSALGSAYLGGLGIRLWDSIEVIDQLRNEQHIFEPKMSPKKREKFYSEWKNAIHALLT